MLNLERDDFLHRLTAHDSFARHFDFFAHGSDPVVVSSADLVFLGTYSRAGDDLVIARPFESATIHDFFKAGSHPEIQAPGGAALSNAVVSALTMFHGGEQYAANASAAAAPKAIGRVEEVTGTADAIRSGQNITLHPGDLVYKGDAVQTGADSSLALTFLDGTAFSLAADARMVLNDMIYEPKSASNSSLLTLVQGSIGFVAGDVAHTGDMKVDTPVATMGIRGTAVKSRVNTDQGKGEFSLLREPDGHVGSIVFYDHRGSGAVLGFLSSASTVLSFEFANGQLTSRYAPSTDLDNNQDQELTKFLFHIRQLGLDHPLREELGVDQPGGGQGGHGGSPQTPEQEQRQDQGGNAGPHDDTQHLTTVVLTQPLNSAITPQSTATGPSIPPAAGTSVTYPTSPTVGGTGTVPNPPTFPAGGGGTETFSLASATGTFGTATIDPATGVVTYTETSAPAAGTAPTDTFSVLVKDAQGVTTTTTASFVVDGGAAVSYAPATVAGTGPVPDTLTVTPGVAGADTFGFAGTTALTESGANGTASINATTGVVTYTETSAPAAGTAQTEAFAVKVTDSQGVTTTTTASFVVDGGAAVSYASATVAGTVPVADTPKVTHGVAGSDTFALTNTQGSYGTASIDASTGVVTYTETSAPAAGTAPTEIFGVKVTDSQGVTTTTTASFVVDGGAAVSYAPATVAGTGPVADTPTVTPGVVGTDTFALTNAQGSYGTASIDASTGVVTYTETSAPAAGTAPTEIFGVKVTDSQGVTTTTTASFVVDGGAAVSYAPATVTGGSNPVSNTLTVTSVVAGVESFALASAQGSYGTASIDPSTGVVTYTETSAPAAGTATETFAVKVTDPLGVTTTATASFVIDGGATVSYAPYVTVGTTAVTDPPTTLSGGVGGDTFALVSDAGTYGTATIDPSTGVITYTPTVALAPGQASPDYIAVAVTDAAGVTTTTIASFVVYGPEDPALPPGQYTISAPTSAIYGFSSNAATNLTLAEPSTFSGQFSGFAGSDTIDLSGFNYSGATFAEKYVAATDQLVLTVAEDGKATTLTFDNFDPAKQSLKFASDGQGGTLISASATPVSVPAPAVEKASSTFAHPGSAEGFVFKPDVGNRVVTDFHAHGGGGSPHVADVNALHLASYQALLSGVTDTLAGEATSPGAHPTTVDGVHTVPHHANLFHL